jgi:hypothetical protein
MLGETGGLVEYNSLGENECGKFGGIASDTLSEPEAMFSMTVMLTPVLITNESFRLLKSFSFVDYDIPEIYSPCAIISPFSLVQ